VATAAAVLCAALTGGIGAAGQPSSRSPVAFSAAGALVLTGSTYELTLSKRNGKFLRLVDRGGGTTLLKDDKRCLWGALGHSDLSYVGGCSFAPRSTHAFSYRWRAATNTLELTYRSKAFGSAVVTLHALPDYLDARMTIRNRGKVLERVRFPDGLTGNTATVSAGYAPNVLPGVLLAPAFFSRVGADVQFYPSRWAFADYLALDVAQAHVALYSVAKGPLPPVKLGFAHLVDPAPCSDNAFCVVHEFQTWIKRGATWTSPVVRIRIGATAQQSILDYRHANGIDAYPSLQSKLGTGLATLAEAPLIKTNLPLLGSFTQLAGRLAELPSPVLLHPVGYEVGGHDASDPDFLPPDPKWGTNADFSSFVQAAHGAGDLVMPYANLSWWDPSSPTMRNLPAGVSVKDVAALDAQGNPESIAYGDHTGVIVSPYAPYVRQRIRQFMAGWQTQVPVDCVFLDQVGARPWLPDFNPAAPSPLDYQTGWLAVLAPYRSRCLMVEDGWDRLARDAVGFHGSLLMMSRETDLPNTFFGQGNWQPYPLATWLFHDKVLLYEHDLYDATMAVDDEVLTWNMAYGLVSSYAWDKLGPGANPWLELVARLQRDFGPHYVGIPLSGYELLGPQATESTFGDLDVVANRDAAHDYSTGGFGVAPSGFLARTSDNSLLAGAFDTTFNGEPLSAGTHHVIVERSAASVVVRQPVGSDTPLAVDPPTSWTSTQTLHATALAVGGTAVGTASGTMVNGKFVFQYAATMGGSRVDAYRVAAQ
jgi:hypothetical protein